MKSFSNWLETELESHGWSQNELAHRANITQGAISHVINGRRNPSIDLCNAIAHAFRLPPEIVLRQAGLLPPAPPNTEQDELILHKLRSLPPEVQADVIEYIEFRAAQQRSHQNKSSRETTRLETS